jgi:hypothetical protein
MSKDTKKGNGKKGAQGASSVPIGFTSSSPGSLAQAPLAQAPLASAVPPLAAVPTGAPIGAPTGAPIGTPGGAPPAEHALIHDAQQRLIDLAVEKETLSVRLEDATRQRAALEEKVAELTSVADSLRTQRSGSDSQLESVKAERDKLAAENQQLQDEILRLPAELETVAKSRAFRIMKAAPILAIRKPLSTLLIVGAMGSIANLWDFSNVARTIYLVVGAIVLLVSAIQFLARND